MTACQQTKLNVRVASRKCLLKGKDWEVSRVVLSQHERERGVLGSGEEIRGNLIVIEAEAV